MSDIVMEFYYMSDRADKWEVIVTAEGEEQFRLQHDNWEGLLEDLTYKTKWELEGVLAVTW
jgi:hypothetical protein